MIDFFCARANLAIEVDGISHDMGDLPVRDEKRDAWLREHRIDTVRFPARDVLRSPGDVAGSIVALVQDRLVRFGKVASPSVANATATSPSQDDGED